MPDIESALREYFEQGGYQKYLNDTVRDILSERPKIKVVIDTSSESFLLTNFAAKQLGIDSADISNLARTDDRLIALVEKYGPWPIFKHSSGIKIAEVPLCSDWKIEHDLFGSESVSW